jgi:hypothetical protein
MENKQCASPLAGDILNNAALALKFAVLSNMVRMLISSTAN